MISKKQILAPLRGFDPVLNPSAQSPELLKPGKYYNLIEDPFLSKIIQNKYISTVEFSVIELLYSFGLRITETLEIQPFNISNTGHIFLTTSKTSEPRIIQPVYSKHFWHSNNLAYLPLSKTYSRFYFYHLFKKLGFYQKYGDNINNSVTHYFRHQLVRNLLKQGFSRESISLFLAHRTFKTLKYYDKD